MPARSWTSHPVWRLLGRPLVFSVPFAIFFLVILRGESESILAALLGFYLVSLVFSLFVNTAVEANRKWVVPRLPVGNPGAGAPSWGVWRPAAS